jgi:thiaminase II
MINWKVVIPVLMILCMLSTVSFGCKIDTGVENTSDLLSEACRFATQPDSFRSFQDADRLGIRLDWIHRSDPVFSLKEPEASFTTDYTFHGEQYTLDDYFERSHVLGFMVLHDDRIMLEEYCPDAGPESRFISNSMAKSIISALTGIAIDKGEINSVNDPVINYLPSLSQSGFKEVTVRQLLQMASGICWNEDYMDKDSDFFRYLMAWSQGTPTFLELAATCGPLEPPGTRFEYQSIDTQVLGQLLESATGTPLNKYCERELWQKLGTESDAFFYCGKSQPQICTAACFCATLRDYGRFGLMMMNGGKLGGHNILSEDWVNLSTTTADASELPLPVGTDEQYAESLGYAYQWWLLDGRVYMAMGIYGQAIYIDPGRHIVIVQTSDWPEPDPDIGWDEMITVMTTIAGKLGSSENLTQQLWDDNYAFYQKILNMPFNQQLLSGELDEAVFREYIIQDYHFLQNYKKVYGILLAKAPDEGASKFIENSIKEIDEEIEAVHNTYILEFHITEDELENSIPNPDTEFYNSFLIKTATLEPFEVGLMAMLPCPWIYYQLGVDMKQSANVQNNQYQAWIDEYTEESWENSETKEIIDFVEKYTRAATPENRQKMKQVFETTMKLEYMFWDGIYRGNKWIE